MTLTQAIRDARAKVLYGKPYAQLNGYQRENIDRLMASSSKYAKAGK